MFAYVLFYIADYDEQLALIHRKNVETSFNSLFIKQKVEIIVSLKLQRAVSSLVSHYALKLLKV